MGTSGDSWVLQPGGCPGGHVSLPGDKSIAHRALLLAGLARGESRLDNVPDGADILSTIGCLRQLGVGVRCDRGSAVIDGRGRESWRVPSEAIHCGNSGTTARLLAGLLAGQTFMSELDGDASLRGRPMERVAAPLREMGARVSTTLGGLPMRVGGGALHGVRYTTPVPSAQVKSCVIFAGLLATGTTIVEEAIPTRDHTERILTALGAPVRGSATRGGLQIQGGWEFAPLAGRVPGDLSSAAYWLVAASLAPGANIVLDYVGWNPGRRLVVKLLRSWGAQIEAEIGGDWHGEPWAQLRVRGAGQRLRGGTITGHASTQLIDELPLLAMLGALTDEGVVIEDAGELRVKESDRIATTAAALRALGVEAIESADGLRVPGRQRFRSGTVAAAGDHRIALAAAAVSVAADGPVEIEGAAAAAVSYPGFRERLIELCAR